MPPARAPAHIVSRFPALLDAARRGDERAWDHLYKWLAPQILGFLRSARITDAEDVLGEVFLEVAKRVDDFEGDHRGFRAWVFTIARARRVDEIRRRVRRREERFDTGEQAAVPAPIDVEAEALASVELDEMLGLLELLTDDQAEVFVLRALGGWTSREIAEITDRTTGSVEQLQHRATQSLRAILTRKETAAYSDHMP